LEAETGKSKYFCASAIHLEGV